MLNTESRPSVGLDQGATARDPWLTNNMDYYLGTDSLSLQEMLDVDIKCEVESLIGGNPTVGFCFKEMSPLELDDDPVDYHSDLNSWFGSASLLNGNSNSSHSNFNLDLNGDVSSIMVNPNSVMPILVSRTPTPSNNSSTRRHFSFPIKSEIKTEKVEVEDDVETGNETDNEHYENDITETEDEEDDDDDDDEEEEESEDEQDEETVMMNAARSIKLKQPQQQQQQQLQQLQQQAQNNQPQQQMHLKTVPTIKTLPPQAMTKITNGQKVDPLAQIRVRNLKLIQQHSPNVQTQHVRKIFNNNMHITSPSTTGNSTLKRDKDFTLNIAEYDEKPYPKPAYSYSCLIAMALKNSQTGSLPVSEIYNFMCEHFPYFKTAPNGWKNSVRHNLSLNKCFEKIEKPAGNGNQRKGCLWAINPQKIAKMDEEVQKWSRKDPLAIKKAMIYPDHLELLERGEMKYAGNGGDDLSEEAESSGDETAEENTTYDEPSLGHIAANSVTDSYDESSQDCDIDITEHLYDEIDIEDNKEALHMQFNIAKDEPYEYELSPSAKRQKTLTGTIQGNYVYQSVATSRRKTPLLVRTGAANGAFLKIE
ncbi:hypothetical protein KQX54_020862 [Cotesia glomerata]|uniref:Fork-head domain-containing protein n=1 Tax=Cotesia glomerata TaxID=32391 RepID=A0AAV7IHV8_COTGL|nr:hypothetical protein KQX54_020862 [Cotesia glomerata]